MSLERCIQGIKGALDDNIDKLKAIYEGQNLCEQDIVIRLCIAVIAGVMQKHMNVPLVGFGQAIAYLCESLHRKQKENAFLCLGLLFCESEKIFTGNAHGEEWRQIIDAFGRFSKVSHSKTLELNIALGILLIAETLDKTPEEIEDSLAKIRKALEGVI